MSPAFAYYLVSSVTTPPKHLSDCHMRQFEVLGNLPLRQAAIGHITDGLVPFLRSGPSHLARLKAPPASVRRGLGRCVPVEALRLLRAVHLHEAPLI